MQLRAGGDQAVAFGGQHRRRDAQLGFVTFIRDIEDRLPRAAEGGVFTSPVDAPELLRRPFRAAGRGLFVRSRQGITWKLPLDDIRRRRVNHRYPRLARRRNRGRDLPLDDGPRALEHAVDVMGRPHVHHHHRRPLRGYGQHLLDEVKILLPARHVRVGVNSVVAAGDM